MAHIFPLEWICSWFTDTLITINKEDFLFAKKHLHAKDIEFVPGVGLEVKTFKNVVVNIAEKRMLYNISETDFVLLSVGELNTNKNHEIVIRAVAEMGRSDMHYIVAGKGPLESYLKKLALELGVEKQVHILGYRTDVAELYKIANLYVHPSFREGLPVAIMECLASGTPCITSNIRGCIDLVKEDYFDPTDVNDVISQIMKNYKNRKANVCLEETYHEDNINKRMKQIYKIGGANE